MELPEPLLDRAGTGALLENGTSQYAWYDHEASKAEGRLSLVWWLGTIAGLLASALAALPASLVGSPWGEITRWIVAILTLLVTLLSGTLASRYRRIAQDREKGRIATAGLINGARIALMFDPMNLRERGQLIKTYEAGLLDIERLYGTVEGRSVEPSDVPQART